MSMGNQFGDEGHAPSYPKHPSTEVRFLRARLVMEEALETIGALGFTPNVYYNEAPNGLPVTIRVVKFENRNLPIDLIEIADGCADLSVVTIGTLSACGIADEPLLQEVDNSNTAKYDVPYCTNTDCRKVGAEMNLISNKREGNYQCSGCGTHQRGWYVREDGKVMKPEGWVKPDIAAVLKAQMPETDYV